MRIGQQNIVVRNGWREDLNPSLAVAVYSTFVFRHRKLDERNPNTNASGTYASYNHEFLQDGKSIYLVTRFLAPGYYDKDPDDELGYWAVRASKMRIYIGVQLIEASTAGYGNSDNVSQWDLWLLDQYFDYTAITWNNPPTYSGLRARGDIAVTIKDNHYSQTGMTIEFELPNATDMRPVPIYGLAAQIRKTSGPDTDCGTLGYLAGVGRWPVIDASADAIQTHDDYAGEYLPK